MLLLIWYILFIIIILCYTDIFYKNTLNNNTEARFAKKMKTQLEHAQPQIKKSKNVVSKFHNLIP